MGHVNGTLAAIAEQIPMSEDQQQKKDDALLAWLKGQNGSQHAALPEPITEAIKKTAEEVRAGRISDRVAFEQLSSAGLPERQAKAVLRVVLSQAELT